LVVTAEDDRAAAEKAERLGVEPATLVGGPEALARGLRRYGDAGADWVVAAPVDSRDPENARLLGERVRPLLTDSA
jgi:alkanesulfonate monooxygenase SsuD/methylene tetrahydromethanopterin reductase-like flavin-dependent oxidoreductase (luciferase family)